VVDKQPKILVVDDSEIVFEVVRDMLEGEGFQVITLDAPLALSDTLQTEHPTWCSSMCKCPRSAEISWSLRSFTERNRRVAPWCYILIAPKASCRV